MGRPFLFQSSNKLIRTASSLHLPLPLLASFLPLPLPGQLRRRSSASSSCTCRLPRLRHHVVPQAPCSCRPATPGKRASGCRGRRKKPNCRKCRSPLRRARGRRRDQGRQRGDEGRRRQGGRGEGSRSAPHEAVVTTVSRRGDLLQ